jgi:lysine-N-methylase
MAGFTLELPTLQNWSCHSCSGCCRQHGIAISDEERARIERQGWTPADGIPSGQPLFVRMGGWLGRRWWRLAHQPDGRCVFLDDKGLCRIHARFGEPAKPLACRIYPYAFHPAGKKVAVSLRFSCPSVVRNLGTPVREQLPDLKGLAKQVVPDDVSKARPPLLKSGARLDWSDVLRIRQALDATLSDASAPVLVRLLRALAWIDLLDQAMLEKISGPRLAELLSLLRDAVSDEIPADLPPSSIGEPSTLGRTQFRLLAGQYARKDSYATSDGSLPGRLRMLRSAVNLARGRGNLPALQERLKEVPYAALEAPFGLPAQTDEFLSRYFLVKIRGMHFCGRAYYDVPMIEGFRSLALVYPAVLWIARWLAVSESRERLTNDNLADALAIADHHHGYSPAFGTFGFRGRVKTLTRGGDIPKLSAWYSR